MSGESPHWEQPTLLLGLALLSLSHSQADHLTQDRDFGENQANVLISIGEEAITQLQSQLFINVDSLKHLYYPHPRDT